MGWPASLRIASSRYLLGTPCLLPARRGFVGFSSLILAGQVQNLFDVVAFAL